MGVAQFVGVAPWNQHLGRFHGASITLLKDKGLHYCFDVLHVRLLVSAFSVLVTRVWWRCRRGPRVGRTVGLQGSVLVLPPVGH